MAKERTKCGLKWPANAKNGQKSFEAEETTENEQKYQIVKNGRKWSKIGELG